MMDEARYRNWVQVKGNLSAARGVLRATPWWDLWHRFWLVVHMHRYRRWERILGKPFRDE